MRLNPPGSDAPWNGNRLKKFIDLDKEVVVKMKKNKN
jgi:hypothetical protein